ncbi:nuclear transport factor 2 family protein [Vibrio cholerae]|nr:nuclear transport factor 2 family protein [Vibrio cholerae]EIJ0935539.1 nuclear transport factor 2 family protein [Vibrio cholerae]
MNDNLLYQKTKKYVEYFDRKDLDAIKSLLSESFKLIDPSVELAGKDKALSHINEIFESVEKFSFKAVNVFVFHRVSVIEFKLTLGDTEIVGADIIDWDHQNQMKEMRAYLYQTAVYE